MEKIEEQAEIGILQFLPTDHFREERAIANRKVPTNRVTPHGRNLVERNNVRNSLDEALRLRRYRALTERDYLMLHAILCLGILSTNHLLRLFWPDSTNQRIVSNRLNKFYKRHLIDHTPECRDYMQLMGLAPSQCHTLGKVGAAALYLEQGRNRKRMSERKRYQIGKGAPLIFHDLLVAETYVRGIEAIRKRQIGLNWYNEEMGNIVEAGGRELVRPDGTFQFNQGERQTSFALEIDRGGTEWYEKVRAYESARDRQKWNQVESDTPRLHGVLVILLDRYFDYVVEVIQSESRQMPYYIKGWSTFLETPFFTHWYAPHEGEKVSLLETPEWPTHS